MIQFFQVIFLMASVAVIVININEFSKWQESRKEGSVKPYYMKWFPFVLTSLVAVGCLLNILVQWMSK
jgi:hypothetical protein